MASTQRNFKKGLRKTQMSPMCANRRWPRVKFLFLCLVASLVALKTLLSSPTTSSNSHFIIAKNATNTFFQAFMLNTPTKSNGTWKTKTTTTSINKSTSATTKPPSNWSVGEIFTNSSLHPRGPLQMLFVVTPTYRRLEQLAELTRLAQTLMNVPALHWIVVEDAIAFSGSVRRLLRRVGLNFTHMLGPKPAKYSSGSVPAKKLLPRGVSNRVAALRWVQRFVTQGVLYFADDDNSYDIRLFEEMRLTKKVSMWPVGLVTHLAVSSPVVSGGRVVGFYDGWVASRKFPVDMAGFAVNIAFLLKHPNVTMPFSVGYEEDGFLRSLGVMLDDIEPRASNCTEVLVWHTKTVSNKPPKKLTKKELDKYSKTNIVQLQANMW